MKRFGVLSWSLLALLAAMILYKLVISAPEPGAVGPVSVSAPAGPALQQAASREKREPQPRQTLGSSQTAPVPSPTASAVPSGVFFGQPLTAWYQQALLPTASVHERTVATRLSVLCASVLSSRDASAGSQEGSPPALPASAAVVGARGLEEWRARDRARSLQQRELQGLVEDCQASHEYNFMSKLRAVGIKSVEYFDLSQMSRPYANRLPVLSGALANPRDHGVEFSIWVDHDLRKLLEDRDGLSMAQSWHARGWLLREVLGSSEQLTLYERTQCAWYGFCQGIDYLTETDQQAAESAARQVLRDLQRQDWPRLIYRRQH